MLASLSSVQQYNYNGGMLKNVYAAVTPDENNVYTSNPDWKASVSPVVVNISSETVNPTAVRSVYVPPPPRDSH
jgi:hypothetical protein